MKLLNLTSNPIKLPNGDTIEPTGYMARVTSTQAKVDTIQGVPILVSESGASINLPEPQEDVLFIVSALVRCNEPHRKDLLSPVKLIRDNNGKPIGCCAFERNP